MIIRHGDCQLVTGGPDILSTDVVGSDKQLRTYRFVLPSDIAPSVTTNKLLMNYVGPGTALYIISYDLFDVNNQTYASKAYTAIRLASDATSQSLLFTRQANISGAPTITANSYVMVTLLVGN